MSSTGGGALAFLNQGVTPSANSSTSQSSQILPSWYTDYTQQILNKAAQFANQPFQLNPNPQLATQSDLTQSAYGQANPLSSTATGNTQAATNLISQATSQNNPLGAAQPYLNAGTDPTYNTVGNYMNPYNQDVTSAISNAANTNFNNYTMPALESGIIGSGNITGSSTEGTNLMENAEQQNEQNITNAQSQALQTGYNGALSAAQAGAQNNLTAGSTAGNLNSSQVQNTGALATGLANIGTAGTSNNIAAINEENALGEQNQGYNQANLNVLNNQWQQQEQYPETQVGIMQGALSGIQVPQAQQNYSYGTGIAGTQTPSVLSSVLGAANTPIGSTSTAPASTLTTTIPGAPGYTP
jgi:hypothetical protein